MIIWIILFLCNKGAAYCDLTAASEGILNFSSVGLDVFEGNRAEIMQERMLYIRDVTQCNLGMYLFHVPDIHISPEWV